MGFFDDFVGDGTSFDNEQIFFVAKVPVKMRISDARRVDKNAKTFFSLDAIVMEGEHSSKKYDIFTGATYLCKKTNKLKLMPTLQMIIGRLLREQVKNAVDKAEKDGIKDPDTLLQVIVDAFDSNKDSLKGACVEITFGPKFKYTTGSGDQKEVQNISNLARIEETTESTSVDEAEF